MMEHVTLVLLVVGHPADSISWCRLLIHAVTVKFGIFNLPFGTLQLIFQLLALFLDVEDCALPFPADVRGDTRTFVALLPSIQHHQRRVLDISSRGHGAAMANPAQIDDAMNTDAVAWALASTAFVFLVVSVVSMGIVVVFGFSLAFGELCIGHFGLWSTLASLPLSFGVDNVLFASHTLCLYL